ncbi:hypothetical protein ANN_06081 [Periplaneta americana]|uniref:Uncharacterized protein n=1 Tax=Periplaneta americana TaxID=6978 RepID=A0ABQ8TEB7_PERAM|nr:hypothetical protein ANN_06081 [Periplaneta americana]
MDNVVINASYEVYEEVGWVSSDGSTRRADIIIIDRQKDKGVILDPTIRFEMHEQQPQEVPHTRGDGNVIKVITGRDEEEMAGVNLHIEMNCVISQYRRSREDSSLMLAGEFQSLGRAIVKEDEYEEVRWDGIMMAMLIMEIMVMLVMEIMVMLVMEIMVMLVMEIVVMLVMEIMVMLVMEIVVMLVMEIVVMLIMEIVVMLVMEIVAMLVMEIVVMLIMEIVVMMVMEIVVMLIMEIVVMLVMEIVVMVNMEMATVEMEMMWTYR